MRTFKLTVAYDGTRYAGWQRQDGADTVQERLEAALAEIEGHALTVLGAGRTDAGVHALGQVASVAISHPIPASSLLRALNAKLPRDVRVPEVREVSSDFHARFSATRKHYRYRIDRGAVANPLDRRYAWHVPETLDLGAMTRAGAALVGRHDFAAFQSAANDAPEASTIRTLFDLRVDAARESVVTIEVVGDGFLRHMVRAIAGTLVEVGLGRRSEGDMLRVLASRNRSRAGPTAPAHGLLLVSVHYSDA